MAFPALGWTALELTAHELCNTPFGQAKEQARRFRQGQHGPQALAQFGFTQHLAQLRLHPFHDLIDALAQALRFAGQRFADEQAADTRVVFRKAEQKIQHQLAALARSILVLKDQRNALKQAVFNELDQALEHLGLAGKMPIQRGLGHTHTLGQPCRGDAIARAVLKHLGQCFENMLTSLGLSRHAGLARQETGKAFIVATALARSKIAGAARGLFSRRAA